MGELFKHQKERKLRFYIVFTLSTLLIVLTSWSCWRWHHITSNQIAKITAAEIDPRGPSSFAFYNMTPSADLLTDPILNIHCEGHELTRQVEQYILFNKDTPATPLLIFGEQELSAGQFPLSTRFFESKVITDGKYFVDKSLLPAHMAIKKPFALKEDTPRPQRWKKISAGRFFWGQNPNNPQEGNIEVHYTCALIPQISLWGAIDEQGRITPDSWLLGVNTLEASEQKQRMIYSLETFHLSSLAVHVFIINALILIILKERFMSPSWRYIGALILSMRKYEVLVSPIVLFISPSFISALIVCTVLVTYGACCLFAKNQQRELLNIERIYFYG